MFMFLIWSPSGDRPPSYKNFPSVGTFSHEFSIAPGGETADQIRKKVTGYLLYHHTKFGGDRASHAGCKTKSVMMELGPRYFRLRRVGS